MTLTLDIGNTTIALVGLNGDKVVFNAKIPADGNFRLPLNNALNGLKINSAVISSVIPSITDSVHTAVNEICGITPTVISAEMYSDILSFAIPEPEKLGLDRIADSAWAAVNLPLPAVTIDIGTAMTFNVIGKGRIFLGGIIAAGIQTSLNSLCEHTAQLPQTALEIPENVIGKNTRECMLSGAVFGAVSMIEGITRRIENELGEKATRVFTGGGAEFVKQFLPDSFIYEPFLTAKGIAINK